ncbi:MAG: hypothetical protein WCA99_07295, partial [Candidatus Sulfotelmatobacter sp.]
MTNLLGGEKWLKEPPARFRVHPMAVVGDDQQNAGEEDTCLSVPRQRRSGYSLKPAVAGLNHDATAVCQDIAGIENQVENNLLGLRLVDFDQSQIGVEPEFQLHVFADQAGQQIPHS